MLKLDLRSGLDVIIDGLIAYIKKAYSYNYIYLLNALKIYLVVRKKKLKYT